MPPVGFEPTISAGEWPQTYALDRAATGTGLQQQEHIKYWKCFPLTFQRILNKSVIIAGT